MAREHHLPPSAASLSSSMRDLGYSLETAIADLIDNSISAEATKVEILCDLTQQKPTLGIIDNGHGMDEAGIINALRHGSKNPSETRSPKDLGRFGLGLKTASFSQCERLTVVSNQGDGLHAAEWNLETVHKKDDWLITILDPEDIEELPFLDKIMGEGTAVIWRNLDRLFEDETGDKRNEIVNEKLDVVERHLSLVFHRFLSGEVQGRKKLSLSINGHPIEPFDPFCRKNSATQMLPKEVVRIDGVAVHMQPYILPHHNKLTAKEYDFYQDRSDFISNQGTYVYRGGRLMAWGDWFRLVPKGEATKLARVQIDFPNCLDEMWTIDIKKSRARPPTPVRDRLRQIIDKVSTRSTTVHRGRGKKLFDEIKAPVWERYADKGNIRYALNKEHPLIEALRSELRDENDRRLTMLIEAISSSLPVEMIYSDFSTHPRDIHQNETTQEEINERLSALKECLFGNGEVDVQSLREVMRSTRFFDGFEDAAEEYIAEELKK
ncbi:ATP-binding protein [Pyruvatibacter sp. HU-CL02332]|uniref:ATP-binding protein n=1 Tax=Pyruvatibacter sp. HU-CL02332 TaxID=3127650 RepID=UPI0033658FF8